MKSIEGAYATTVCKCGTTGRVRTTALANGSTKSCGCLNMDLLRQRAKHGHARSTGLSSTYVTWQSMLRRCEMPNATGYQWYGGRGIKIAPEWHDFGTFLRDMGERPSPKHTLDRRDANGDYTPQNCRWATRTEQSTNRRNTVWITFEGQTLCMSEWARVLGLSVITIRNRLHAGMPVEQVLSRKDLRHA